MLFTKNIILVKISGVLVLISDKNDLGIPSAVYDISIKLLNDGGCTQQPLLLFEVRVLNHVKAIAVSILLYSNMAVTTN